MKLTNELLLKLSFLSGIIPLIGGWGIFLTWLLGRYLNASDFKKLEGIGFMWMIICFFVATAGLFLLLVYVIINRDNLHREMLIVLVVILINIPSVVIILSWQKSVSRMQFIKIINATGTGDLRCEILENEDILITSKTIYESKSKVLNFYLYHAFATFRPYQGHRDLKLVISNLEKKNEIPFSKLNIGSCKHIVIDENLEIKREAR